MKIPTSSSLLFATLAASSSSALVAPSGEGHQGNTVNTSASGSALASSTSSESLGPKESSLSERDIQDSIAERGLLEGVNGLTCSLANTIAGVIPLPILNDLLCHIGKEGGVNPVNEDKAQAEISRLSSILRAAVPTSASSPSPSASTSSSSDMNSGGTPLNNSRVDAAGSPANPATAATSNASDTSVSSSASSMSASSIWRAQPTPANSPSLPIDSPSPETSSSNATSTPASGSGRDTSTAFPIA